MCRKKKSLGLGLGETVGLPEIGPWNKTPVTSSLSLYAVTLYKYKKVRDRRVELLWPAWEAGAQPIGQSRIIGINLKSHD